MSKTKPLIQQTTGSQLMVSKKSKSASADRKAWKNKLKRKQRRH
jgi:hypothetical protein